MNLLSEESLQFAFRIGIADVGGFLIGVERDLKGKNAGMRSNILMAIGAALFALVALNFRGSPEADFLRVIGRIVT
jgi:putative Mg2+ transporter-C (MgtC) family protein